MTVTSERVRKNRKTPVGAFRRKQAAVFVSMGQATFDRADAAGLVPAGYFVGGCKLWNKRELAAWLDHGCPDREAWGPLWRSLLNHRQRVR